MSAGWKLSETRIRELASRVSAGKPLRPHLWPGGARMAVLLSFDVDCETWDLMNGGTPSVMELSQGTFGARVGLSRVVRLLKQHDVPATFFVPAVSVMLHPGIVDLIREDNRHEIGAHGWIHEHPAALEPENELELLERSVAFLERHAGLRPVGYRAPGYDPSPHTVGLLRRLGFLYDSSLMADDSAYEIDENGTPTGLVELPVDWTRDDATLLDPRGENTSSPSALFEVLRDELDGAHDEGGMFLLVMHPRVIGRRSRLVLLEKLLAHAASKDGVWYATHEQAASFLKKQFLDQASVSS